MPPELPHWPHLWRSGGLADKARPWVCSQAGACQGAARVRVPGGRQGAGASQGAEFLSCGSSTSLALIAVCADERARAPETGQTRALGMAGPTPPFFLMEE